MEPGGVILFARDRLSGEIVGTCALMPHGDEFELAKMGVLETERGREIGHKLGLAIMDKAREMGLRQIFLGTNSSLAPAIRLYRKLGFVQVDPPTPSEYIRADVYMIADL